MAEKLPLGREETLTTVKLCDNGDRIARWVFRYAYPRNGNLHNPTPTYMWERIDASGRVVYVGNRKKDVDY